MAEEAPKKVSLAQKNTPAQVWEWCDKKTSHGTRFIDCITSALENPKSNVGIYAPDPECYDVFSDLFHPIIAEYHKVDVATLESKHNLGTVDDIKAMKDLPENFAEKVVSTRVRVGRTVKGFPMQAALSPKQRLDLEEKIKEALSQLDGELKGTYKSLNEMSHDEKTSLIEEHLLFNDADDKCLRDANGYGDWPNGRGIFMNDEKNFIVWVNEEDHIRIISMQKGASLTKVWERLVTAIQAMEKKLEFVCHPKFGHLTFCPTNIGTGLRASVHVNVGKIAELKQLDGICAEYNLQPRGVHGEHTESVGGIYDISNKIRIGRTEWELINDMWTGVNAMLEKECAN
jgi:arginine kinase